MEIFSISGFRRVPRFKDAFDWFDGATPYFDFGGFAGLKNLIVGGDSWLQMLMGLVGLAVAAGFLAFLRGIDLVVAGSFRACDCGRPQWNTVCSVD